MSLSLIQNAFKHFYAGPELTHKNHFIYGYNSIPFSSRRSENDKWFVRYGSCQRPALNFREECLETAKVIRQKTQDPLYVMFSGGADSEVVLRSFVEANIPVTAAIMRFQNDLNIHDISWAVIICDQLKVPYQIFDLDLLDFWKNHADVYANATYCVSPQLLSTMWLVDQIPGYAIMGSAECLFVKPVPEGYQPGISPYLPSEWSLWEKEKIASWYRHFMVRQRNGCPGFFQYTPEIILAYLQDSFVQKLIQNEIIGKLSTESSKLKIYQQHFPLMDRPKYTGFEKVQAEDSEYRKRLRERFPAADAVQKTPLSVLHKWLTADL